MLSAATACSPWRRRRRTCAASLGWTTQATRSDVEAQARRRCSTNSVIEFVFEAVVA
jgi:hypothetical protein